MELRRRLCYFLSLIPSLLILLGARIAENYQLVFYVLIFDFVISIFSNQLYNIFFYNYCSPCSFYAGRIALENNYNPCDPKGEYWDPKKITPSEIYKLYLSSEKSYIPEKNTAGFVFYKNLIGRVYKMDFYDNTNEPLIIHNFHFHSYNPKGDTVLIEKITKIKISKLKIYIKLNEMNNTMYNHK